MKTLISKPISIGLLLLSAALLNGCGTNTSSGSLAYGAGVGGIGGGSACITAQALYSGTGYTLTFQMANGYVDYANIIVGQLPNSQGVGQAVITGGGVGIGQVSGNLYRAVSGYGALSMAIQASNYYSQTQIAFSGTGSLVLGPTLLASMLGSSYGVNGGQQVCVSGISMQMGHTGQTLYGGYVYLLLSTGQVYPVMF